jgi:competence protein ComEC
MFFWSRFPFVRVVLFFVSGILAGIYYPGNESQVITGLITAIIILTFLVLNRRRWILRFNYLYGINLSLIFLLFGYVLVTISNDSNNHNHLLNFGEGSYYIGRVISSPQTTGDYVRVKIDLSAIKDSSWHDASGNVLAYIKLPLEYKPGYGDKLIIKGFPQQVSPPLNPHEFDYRRYLAYKNIYHQHFINSDKWQLIEPASGFSLRRMSINARSFLEKKLTLYIQQPEELSVAKALILGKKEDLDTTTKEIYATAGAMHVLAVSGLHVGIIYLVLLGLLGQKQGRITRPLLVAIIVIPTLWGYAFITGLSPSVLRAVAMFSFLALAQVLNRKSASLNILAISAFILLLVNPYMIMAVGFQLSYIAVAGIIFLYPLFERWLNPSNPVLRFIWQITALSLAAQLVTAPLSAFYFHRFPTYFLFSNLLVIPAATIIVWGGLVLLTLGTVSSALGLLLGKMLSMIIWLVNQALHWITTLPNANIYSLTTTVFDTWILYGLIFIVMLFFTTRKWTYYWLAAGLLFIFSLNIIYTDIKQNKLKQLVFYSVNRSWAIDFIEDKNYLSIADSVLLADKSKIDFLLTPYRRQNGLSPGSKNIKQQTIPDLGLAIVWHGKRILLASPCLEEKDIPLNFDYVLYRTGRTPQNCYQEQILLRKFVNNQVLSYTKYNLRSQGALIVDI